MADERNHRFVSADDHIDLRWLPRDLWTERLPAALKDRAPHIEDTDTGSAWVCDGKRWSGWGRFAYTDGTKGAIEASGQFEDGVLRPTTPHLRLEDMDR